MTIEAIVFDLDGVIIDSEEVWEEVRRGYVAEHGREFLPDTQDRMMGMSTAEWSRHLSVDVGVGVPPDQVLMVGDSAEADGAAAAIGCRVAIVEPLPVDERPAGLLDVLAAHGLT